MSSKLPSAKNQVFNMPIRLFLYVLQDMSCAKSVINPMAGHFCFESIKHHLQFLKDEDRQPICST